jgi:hypothetical protein
MKHLRLFENILSVPIMEIRVNSMHIDIDNYFEELLQYIDGDFIKIYEAAVCGDYGGYLVTHNISKIGNNKILYEDNSKDTIEFKELHIDSKVEIIKHLMKELKREYKYQKDIITNEPHRISDIIYFLHPDIKKEYPHLDSGKDLGLLK